MLVFNCVACIDRNLECGMQIKELLKIIEKYLPGQSGMEGDRIGLQIQSGRNEVNKLLITLELNDQVIQEAINSSADCIISFHPLIYNPLLSISDDDRVGELTTSLIKNDISFISIHTTFDAFAKGTSHILAEKLDLKVIDFLEPNANYSDKGMGIIATPLNPINSSELLERVYNVCNSPIRFSELKENININRIAIVGGSGTSFLDQVLKSNVQSFITADITYHRFHEVDGKIMLIDPGHYEMEQFVPNGLTELLKDALIDQEYDFIKTSNILTNPVNYFPDNGKYKNLSTQ